MDNLKISQMNDGSWETGRELLETSEPITRDEYKTTKVTSKQVADFIAKTANFDELQTEAKTILEAINEASQSGGSDFDINSLSFPSSITIDHNHVLPIGDQDGNKKILFSQLLALFNDATGIGDLKDVFLFGEVKDGDVISWDAEGGMSGEGGWTNRGGLFKTKAYASDTVSVTAQDYCAFSADSLGVSKIDGYTPISIVGLSVSTNNAVMANYNLNASGSQTFCSFKNASDRTISLTMGITILYVRNNFISSM